MIGRTSLLTLVLVTTTVHAPIYRWDNRQMIPGIEGITPRVGVQLIGWSAEAKDPRFGDFQGDPSPINFDTNSLDDTRVARANPTKTHLLRGRRLGNLLSTSNIASLMSATFTHSSLIGSTSTVPDLSGSIPTLANPGNPQLTNAKLIYANPWQLSLIDANSGTSINDVEKQNDSFITWPADPYSEGNSALKNMAPERRKQKDCNHVMRQQVSSEPVCTQTDPRIV